MVYSDQSLLMWMNITFKIQWFLMRSAFYYSEKRSESHPDDFGTNIVAVTVCGVDAVRTRVTTVFRFSLFVIMVSTGFNPYWKRPGRFFFPLPPTHPFHHQPTN